MPRYTQSKYFCRFSSALLAFLIRHSMQFVLNLGLVLSIILYSKSNLSSLQWGHTLPLPYFFRRFAKAAACWTSRHLMHIFVSCPSSSILKLSIDKNCLHFGHFLVSSMLFFVISSGRFFVWSKVRPEVELGISLTQHLCYFLLRSDCCFYWEQKGNNLYTKRCRCSCCLSLGIIARWRASSRHCRYHCSIVVRRYREKILRSNQTMDTILHWEVDWSQSSKCEKDVLIYLTKLFKGGSG